MERGSEADDYYHWYVIWRILQCRGCEYVFVQTVSTNSEDYENSYDDVGNTVTDYTETIRYWPSPAKRSYPEWMSKYGIQVPNVEKLDEVVLELYTALDADLRRLSAVGVRTTFDVASEILGVGQELSFRAKLSKLVDLGHIGAPDKDRLAAIIDAGSASAHRGWKPELADLSVMMDILEHFIFVAFVEPARRKSLDTTAMLMAARVPQRTTGNRGSV